MSAKVLLITNNFPPGFGGSGVVYANLARHAGGRILVLAPRLSYADTLPMIGWREYDRMARFRVVRLPLLRTTVGVRRGAKNKAAFMAKDLLIRGRLAWSVLTLLVHEQIRTVCVGELLASGWILQLLSYVPGIRTVVYVHGEEITTADPYDPDFVRRRRALSAVSKIVVVSRFTQRAVLALLGEREARRIVLIENGVDTTRFHPAPRNQELISRYRLMGQFVFITVCRLLEKKGVDHALRAFARLLPEHPATRYLIVGSGPYEPELRALVAELSIAHAVEFAGSVAEHELADHYRLGDVFVMPNRSLPNGDTEGFGLVFLEANGCGLPVIAGQDGGSVDAVRDDENGLVVNGHSVPAIYAAMTRLRVDDALRARLAQLSLLAAGAADWTSRADAFLCTCVDK
ncbi:MAG: glycosyltransferase family 4 protein [Rhodopila sp.]|jgi:phosphatidylinositol alpha-1,6-mannosyltransferase